MEELFENKTKYTDKDYNTFLESYKQEYAGSERAYLLYNLIFFGFCAFFAFKTNEIVLGIAIVVGLLVYLWFKLIRPARNVEKTKKGPKLNGKFTNTYKFNKRFFKVENPDGNAQIVYFKLYRVVETKEYFYLYISRDYAFIVSKLGFTKGTSQEFSEFIKKKVFTKYKDRRNRNK